MKEKKKMGFFRRNYREVLDYIRESKSFIYSAITIFLFFVFLGFFLPVPARLESIIMDLIEKLLQQTEGLSRAELIRFIFWNNVQSSFVGMLFGVFLSIFPALSVLSNEYVLGFVASRATGGNGLLVLWRLLPHGIFELPALFISLGLGLKLGTFVFEKKKIETLKRYLLKSLKTFFLLIIPLLIIAAVIEGILISVLG